MKTLLTISILFSIAFSFAEAQTISPKRLKLLEKDLLAQKESRLDKNNKKCAVIRFDIVGIDNLNFKEAIGDVTYSDNEYIVYVAENTKKLTYYSQKFNGVIDLENFGPEVESGLTYRLTMEREDNMRSGIFYVIPVNAKVIVNGKQIQLDNTGKGSIELPSGTYNYSISADGFVTENGYLELNNNELFETKDIKLQEIKHKLQIKCSDNNGTLFVDGKLFGSLGTETQSIELTEGKHDIRVTKEGYKEYNKTINIGNTNELISITLDDMNKIKYHKEERTKSTISLRNHADILFSGYYNKDVEDNENRFGGKIAANFHQYLGYFAFNEGISIGAIGGNEDSMDLFTDGLANEGINAVMNFDVPLQLGYSIPLSKYNTSQMAFFVGGYGTLYYYSSDEKENNITWDYGLRGNISFYFNKFIISFEVSRSLSDNKLGNFVGIGLGYRIYKRK